MFGAASAVLHYNVLSRLYGSMMCRLFGIPCIGYFGDFVSSLPRTLSLEGLEVFKRFHNALRIVVEDDKCDEGGQIEFLGVVAQPSSGGVKVSISEERKQKLLECIREILCTGSFPRESAYPLGGKLSFAQTMAFQKVGRSFFPLIYQHDRSPSDVLGKALRNDLEWWVQFPEESKPKILRSLSKKVDLVAYTDASGGGGLGAVLIRDGKRETLWGVADTDFCRWVGMGTSEIFCLEILAALATVVVAASRFPGNKIMFYVDNKASLSSITRGAVMGRRANKMVRCTIAAQKDMFLWFERVSSKDNHADFPSRNAGEPGWGSLPVKETVRMVMSRT